MEARTKTLAEIFDDSLARLHRLAGRNFMKCPIRPAPNVYSFFEEGVTCDGSPVGSIMLVADTPDPSMRAPENVPKGNHAVFQVFTRLGFAPHGSDLAQDIKENHADVVFFGVYTAGGTKKESPSHTLVCTPPGPDASWVDPRHSRAYDILSRDAGLRFAARLGLHVGSSRDPGISPHISRHGVDTRDRDARMCFIDWLRRCSDRNPGALRDDIYGAGVPACVSAAVEKWVEANEVPSLIPTHTTVLEQLRRIRCTVQKEKRGRSLTRAVRGGGHKAAPAQTPPPPQHPGGSVRPPSSRTMFQNTVFASELEARWALVFARLQIDYQYESICVRSSGFEKLLPDMRAGHRSYKPDFFLRRSMEAVEVKPTLPSREERMLAAEFARVQGPIVLLFGGSGTSHGGSLFRYSDDKRNRSVSVPGNPPIAVRYDKDTDAAGASPTGVVATMVDFGRDGRGRWGFVPVAEVDETLGEADRAFLRETFAEVAAHRF